MSKFIGVFVDFGVNLEHFFKKIAFISSKKRVGQQIFFYLNLFLPKAKNFQKSPQTHTA